MNKHNIPSNYSEAVSFLNGRNSKTVKGIRYTAIERINNDKIAMYYHNTPVVTWEKDGVTLNSRGFHTFTTKKRMNQGLTGTGFTVYQHKGDWYLHQADGNIVHPFYDGMKV